MNPLARDERLVIEEIGHDLLVYDLRTDAAHHLDTASSRIWRAADGTRSVTEIAALAGVPEDSARRTLAELAGRDLLVDGADAVLGTRRQALKTFAIAGGAAASLPAISSLIAPTPAQASSLGGPGAPCATGADCASGLCVANLCSGSSPRQQTAPLSVSSPPPRGSLPRGLGRAAARLLGS